MRHSIHEDLEKQAQDRADALFNEERMLRNLTLFRLAQPRRPLITPKWKALAEAAARQAASRNGRFVGKIRAWRAR